MINFITFIAVMALMLGIVGWHLRLSPMARSTRELTRLNRIWGDFNKNKDKIQARRELRKNIWKYHREKVEMLYRFMNIIK